MTLTKYDPSGQEYNVGVGGGGGVTLNALSADTPDKLAWEHPSGTDVVELFGLDTAAGLTLAQLDDFAVDSTASYTVLAGSAFTWSSGALTLPAANPSSYEYVRTAWPVADDQTRVSARMRTGSDTSPPSTDFLCVGFSKGVAQQALGIELVRNTTGTPPNGDVYLVTGDYGGSGGNRTRLGGLTGGAAANTYYTLRFTRNGNNYTAEVLDSAGTTTLFSLSAALPVGSQAAYGAGVSLKPGWFAGVSAFGTTATILDDLKVEAVTPEQRDLFVAITPASGGIRTVRRLLGWSGSALERSDLPLDASVGLAKLSATGTKDATTFLRGDNTFAVPPNPTGNGSPNTQTGNYTLALTDAGKTVEANSASALTITVPPNSSVAFPVGTIIEVARYGAGTVAIAAGVGVTIRSRSGLLSIGNQYDAVSLRKRASDEWVCVGSLS